MLASHQARLAATSSGRTRLVKAARMSLASLVCFSSADAVGVSIHSAVNKQARMMRATRIDSMRFSQDDSFAHGYDMAIMERIGSWWNRSDVETELMTDVPWHPRGEA